MGKGKNTEVASAKTGGKSELTRTINSIATVSSAFVKGFLFVKRSWKKTKAHSRQMLKRGIPH